VILVLGSVRYVLTLWLHGPSLPSHHTCAITHQLTFSMQACRANPEVRKQVAAAIINAITNNEVAKAADIPTQNVVVRFSEA
jgi:hypothetical protein